MLSSNWGFRWLKRACIGDGAEEDNYNNNILSKKVKHSWYGWFSKCEVPRHVKQASMAVWQTRNFYVYSDLNLFYPKRLRSGEHFILWHWVMMFATQKGGISSYASTVSGTVSLLRLNVDKRVESVSAAPTVKWRFEWTSSFVWLQLYQINILSNFLLCLYSNCIVVWAARKQFQLSEFTAVKNTWCLFLWLPRGSLHPFWLVHSVAEFNGVLHFAVCTKKKGT